MTLRIHRLSPTATIPTRAHDGDAGFDLAANEEMDLNPDETRLVGTGVAIALPPGTVGLVCPRSGLAARHGVTVLNAPGIVDENYRGEVKVILTNHGAQALHIEPGMRVAQLVVTNYRADHIDVVDTLDDTVRGVGGFGSSGR